jgi:hypothetical protein
VTDYRALGERLLACFAALDEHFGHEPHWWPVITDDPPFEVLVGAVLVQQTRWETVETAIIRLRDAGLMSPEQTCDGHYRLACRADPSMRLPRPKSHGAARDLS